MKSFLSVLAGLGLLAAMWGARARAPQGTKPGTPGVGLASTSVSPPVAVGLKVQVDPVTHRRVTPPANLAPDPAAQKMFNSSHEGLVEEPGTTAAGGFKVDLQGRFQSAVSVSVGADGKPALHHTDGPVDSQPAR